MIYIDVYTGIGVPSVNGLYLFVMNSSQSFSFPGVVNNLAVPGEYINATSIVDLLSNPIQSVRQRVSRYVIICSVIDICSECSGRSVHQYIP